MTQCCKPVAAPAAPDHNSTIMCALELSSTKWLLALQTPGVEPHSRHTLGASHAALTELIDKLKARAAKAGKPARRVILTYEAGRDGFWLARLLREAGVEVHVMHAASLPVDRRKRRAKTGASAAPRPTRSTRRCYRAR